MVNVKPVTEMYQKMSGLKTNMTLSYLSGDYKSYKNAHKELAKLAIQDFKTFKDSQGINVTGSVPVFSKTFRKIAKVILLDKLRIKTAEEKKFALMCEEEQNKQKFKDAVRNRIEQDIRKDIDTMYKDKIDALVSEQTDRTMNLISPDMLDTLAEDSISAKNSEKEHLVNSAIKEIPRFLMQRNRENVNDAIFNKKFMEEAIKNK